MSLRYFNETLTLVVPHPETVVIVPAGGSNSEAGGGKLTALADGTLKSKGEANYLKNES